MLILQKHIHISRIVVAGPLLGLAGCGSGSRLMNSGNFSGTVATQSDRATGTLTSRARVANVTQGPAHLMGGASTEITVNLTQPAPGGGIAVQLKSSDASVVANSRDRENSFRPDQRHGRSLDITTQGRYYRCHQRALRGYRRKDLAQYRSRDQVRIDGRGTAIHRHDSPWALRIDQSYNQGDERIRSSAAVDRLESACRGAGEIASNSQHSGGELAPLVEPVWSNLIWVAGVGN